MIALIFLWSSAVAVTISVLLYTSGLMMARHFPGLVKPGDCVAVVGQEVDA